jgi:hypothetical protein
VPGVGDGVLPTAPWALRADGEQRIDEVAFTFRAIETTISQVSRCLHPRPVVYIPVITSW